MIEAAPDRIAMYSYAHVPHLFKAQRRISEAELPTPDTKLALLELAIDKVTGAGFVYIGMDHFAKPDDALPFPVASSAQHQDRDRAVG